VHAAISSIRTSSRYRRELETSSTAIFSRSPIAVRASYSWSEWTSGCRDAHGYQINLERSYNRGILRIGVVSEGSLGA